jgi:hypothetical protein
VTSDNPPVEPESVRRCWMAMALERTPRKYCGTSGWRRTRTRATDCSRFDGAAEASEAGRLRRPRPRGERFGERRRTGAFAEEAKSSARRLFNCFLVPQSPSASADHLQRARQSSHARRCNGRFSW